MNKSCFIANCSKYKEKNTSFHRFPTDPHLRNRWIESITKLGSQKNASIFLHRSSYVCGHHFIDGEKYVANGNKTMLHKNVVPTIFPASRGSEPDNLMITQSFISPSQLLPDNCGSSSSPSWNTCSSQRDAIKYNSFIGQSNSAGLTEIVSSQRNEKSDEERIKEEDPLSDKNDYRNQQSSCTNSDSEDFLGFEAADLKNEIVDASTGEVYVVFDVVEEMETNASHTNLPESKEVDDELIIIENDVEIIEIDDDDDVEVPTSKPPPPPPPLLQLPQTRKKVEFSKYDIQQMVYDNDPLVELRKPQLNWKSDQFRLLYVNGEKQNLCICTKCSELFAEINIDTIVRHARCNPTPSVSPNNKRKRLNDQQIEGNSQTQKANDTLEKSAQNVSGSKIQAIAACIDVQTSTFFQSESFLHLAQVLVNAGASTATTNKSQIRWEPKYDVLCTFRDQLKNIQLSKIRSILNTPDLDFSFSCDVWEDGVRDTTNVSLELHYLDTSFLLQRIVIGVRSINGVTVDDKSICEQIIDMLKTYSNQKNGAEFLEKATAFVTLGKRDIKSLGIIYFPSACSVINDVANRIINEEKLGITEKCLQIIGLLNLVSSEKITVFDAKRWENIFDLFETFNNKKSLIMKQDTKTIVPNDQSVVRLLQPFHEAIKELNDSKNSITKVFGIYKMLEKHLVPLSCDKEIFKTVKTKAMLRLRAAFADSDIYQICMFLDPSNRDRYDSLESEKMDCLQSKIDAMINPYTTTKENGCVDNDLVNYMDDSVTSQQNQIELFLQLSVSHKDDALEYWRHNEHTPGLKKLAKKYFTIPTYVSQSECIFSNHAKDFLVKRKKLDTKDVETMLMMNSSQFIQI